MSILLNHVILIENSWQSVQKIKAKFFELFVGDVLSNNEAAKIFKSERGELEKKMAEFLEIIVSNLKTMENVFPMLVKESKKRKERGATEEIYNSISVSLMNTLEKALGFLAFDEDTRLAWKSLLQVITKTLVDNMHDNVIENNIQANDNKLEEEDDKCLDYEALNVEAEQLKFRLFAKGLADLIKDRRYFLKKYTKVLIGSEMVQFLIEKKEAKDVNEAIEIGNKLIDFDYMHHVHDEHTFKNDSFFYRFRDDEEDDNKEDRNMSVVKVRQNCEVGKQGFALVKGFQFWTRRYLVLRNDLGKLYMYENEGSIKPKKILYIDSKFSCSVKEIADCKKGYYCFNIQGVHEALTIATQRSVDQEQWIEALVACGASLESTAVQSSFNSFWELSALDIDGKNHPMSQHTGKVVLVVNVATNWLTKINYTQLQELYLKYKDSGLEILAFPCNQFGFQEPGENHEIKDRVIKKYDITFPLMAKIKVNGKETHPVYEFLRSKISSMLGSSIKWNFTKFLVNRDGVPVFRASPTTHPVKIEPNIIELLKETPKKN